MAIRPAKHDMPCVVEADAPTCPTIRRVALWAMAWRLLLDTHTFIWAVATRDELSRRARGLIESPSNELFVSAASAWEISTKDRLGKFPQAEAIIRGFSFAIDRLRSNELSISVEHALTAGDFDQPHRDPFDRMLAAQAVVEGATLITRDVALAQFPINIEWEPDRVQRVERDAH